MDARKTSVRVPLREPLSHTRAVHTDREVQGPVIGHQCLSRLPLVSLKSLGVGPRDTVATHLLVHVARHVLATRGLDLNDVPGLTFVGPFNPNRVWLKSSVGDPEGEDRGSRTVTGDSLVAEVSCHLVDAKGGVTRHERKDPNETTGRVKQTFTYDKNSSFFFKQTQRYSRTSTDLRILTGKPDKVE